MQLKGDGMVVRSISVKVRIIRTAIVFGVYDPRRHDRVERLSVIRMHRIAAPFGMVVHQDLNVNAIWAASRYGGAIVPISNGSSAETPARAMG